MYGRPLASLEESRLSAILGTSTVFGLRRTMQCTCGCVSTVMTEYNVRTVGISQSWGGSVRTWIDMYPPHQSPGGVRHLVYPFPWEVPPLRVGTYPVYFRFLLIYPLFNIITPGENCLSNERDAAECRLQRGISNPNQLIPIPSSRNSAYHQPALES